MSRSFSASRSSRQRAFARRSRFEPNTPPRTAPPTIAPFRPWASTEQAQTAVADEAVRIVKAYVESGDVPNCVNLEKGDIDSHVLILRHYNKPGVLAFVCGELNNANVNVQETRNSVLAGAKTCCAQIHLESEPPAEALERIRDHDLVLSTRVVLLK